MWFKEYVFNIIIQPFHLIIYTVLVSSAIELATSSMIYAIIAIYFVIPAEKLLRKFFGFDKAGTLSAAGSFAGGAVFSAMINKLNKPKPRDQDDGGDKTPNVRKNSKVGTVDPAQELLGTAAASGAGAGGAGGSGAPGGSGTGGIRRWSWRWWHGNRRSRRLWHRRNRPEEVGVDPSLLGSYGVQAGLRDSVLPDGMLGLAESGERGFRGRVSDAIFAGAGNIKSKAIKGAKTLPKTMGRKLRRGAVGAAGAIPLAMLAAGVGAATGDPSKAAALAAAGATAGYNFTNYYGDKVAKGVGGATGSAKAAFWGEDYKKVMQHKFDKEFLSSPELMDSLTKALGSRSAAREAIQSGDIQAFLNNNVTDAGKIAKAMKLREKYAKAKDKGGLGMSADEALQRSVAMAKWNRDANPGIFNPMSREQTAWKNNLMKQLVDSGTADQSGARKIVDDILEDLDYFNS